MSSRVWPIPGAQVQTWHSPTGTAVVLPLIVDLIEMGEDGRVAWAFEATVGLRDGTPVLLRLCLEAGESMRHGLDTMQLQQNFRWNTPVEIVTRLVPRVIETGGDPFDFDFPHHGFPEVTQPRPGHRLTREFLVDVARDYLVAEPPYAETLAARYNVTPRTVISWVEKARQRGILGGGAKGRKDRSIQA